MHRVVIIGGGFGGLHAARSLRRAPVEVTLVDRRNHHLFQPLLYQVATGALSPANIASPLRSLLRRQRNSRVLLAEARAIDVARRRVLLDAGGLEYDSLIVAAGSSHSYFGHDEWEAFAPGLKSLEDATHIRRQILWAFEAAERSDNPDETASLLTFVVVGAGPTGVELVGQVAEIAHYTLRNEFRRINPGSARVLLVEGFGRVLGPYPPDLSSKAERALRDLGVEVWTNALVTNVERDRVIVRRGDETHTIHARTILWAAGVQASALGKLLAGATGAAIDRAGRVIVEPDLSLAGHSEIFVIGDMAHFAHQTGKPLPAVAPVAMQQGKYVAKLIERRLAGRSMPPFRYRDWGTMATIGRYRAVADFGFVRFDGSLAWLTWLFVHLMQLVQFQNRLLVFIQWGWHYVTRNRAARLITGPYEAIAPGEVQLADRSPLVDAERRGSAEAASVGGLQYTTPAAPK
jgi:NADH dehydrogenase